VSERLPADAVTALAPVREALLAAAHTDAQATAQSAEWRAVDGLAAARQAATGLIAQARSEGSAEAAGLVATDQARARRQARAVVLTAQRDLYDELRACSRAAVARLRDDPDYPRMLARLSDRARAALGSAAVLGEPEDGGIVATDGVRRVDFSLPTLADRAFDASAVQIRRSWEA